MSSRVKAIRAAVREILKDPADPREVELLAATLAYYEVQAMAALMRRSRAQATNGYVSAERAHQMTGLSSRWFYEHAHELPFARRKGGRVLFEQAALQRWMDER